MFDWRTSKLDTFNSDLIVVLNTLRSFLLKLMGLLYRIFRIFRISAIKHENELTKLPLELIASSEKVLKEQKTNARMLLIWRFRSWSDCLVFLFSTHPKRNAFYSLTSTHKSPKQLHLPFVAKREAGLHSREVWVTSIADFLQHNKKTNFNLKTWSYHTSKN